MTCARRSGKRRRRSPTPSPRWRVKEDARQRGELAQLVGIGEGDRRDDPRADRFAGRANQGSGSEGRQRARSARLHPHHRADRRDGAAGGRAGRPERQRRPVGPDDRGARPDRPDAGARRNLGGRRAESEDRPESGLHHSRRAGAPMGGDAGVARSGARTRFARTPRFRRRPRPPPARPRVRRLRRRFTTTAASRRRIRTACCAPT